MTDNNSPGDEFEGLDDLFTDPNGPAYQRSETRRGPPLEYVAQKLREALRELHQLHKEAAALVASAAAPATGVEWPAAELKRGTHAAFYYSCVSYLALQNMLAHANPPSFVERLFAMTGKEFRGWLDDIDRGGSVT